VEDSRAAEGRIFGKFGFFYRTTSLLTKTGGRGMKTKIFYFALLMVILNVGLVWGGVSDIFVLGDTFKPPRGYTYTKMTINSSDSWTVKADMPTARAALAAVAVNGKIYAIGGGWGWFNGSYLNKTEKYDPVTNKWSAKADMPTARAGLAAVAVNGKIYAIGGTNYAGGALKTTDEYDPVTNTWSAKADMPTVREGLAAVEVNGKIYAIGGSDGVGGALKTTEEYDPATNTWTVKADMPTSGCFLAAVDVNGIIYAIGGMDANETPLQANAEFSPPVLFYIHRQD
jgi:N-acetylneuraminic acid mutarotase